MEELVKNELLFYSQLAKPLILNLPKSRDRVLSAAWLKKFADENAGDEKLRTTYLKLLLFCLQRRSLSGIFADDPSNYEILEELPQDIDLNEFARNLLEQERVERRELILAELMGDIPVFPAFTTDCSPDLTEYVAAQDIPNFGVHAYYAISKQPINKWQRSELAIFPKGTKSAIDTTQTTATPAVAPQTPKISSSTPEVEQPAAEEGDSPPSPPSPERKKRRPKKLGASPPTHPLGEVRKPSEERPTPTWGTNLVEVRERTDVGHIEEPTEAEIDLEKQVAKMLQEQSDDGEEEASARPSEDTVASVANEMSLVLDEFQRSKMDKPKKKPPSRLAKLGDRSGLKAPKSTKAPKIEVKGMKKKAKGGIGPRPDNLPEEFADWTEKELEEAGLTWQDLMPIDENIDEELQRIEDEEMKDLSGGEVQDESLHLEDIQTDYDALLREAEAELAEFQEVYGAGVEEDEPVVELFQDEIEEMENRLNISHEVENVRTASPAITKGIPVTTPQRSARPKRVKSPEKVYAEDDDFLLKHRRSPLQPPKPQKREIPKRPLPKPKPPSDKDPNISMVFEKAQKVIPSPEERAGKRPSPGRCPPSPQASEAAKRSPGRSSPSRMTEDEEFEMYESMFKQQSPDGGRHVTLQEQPSAGPSAVEERARQQEMMLRLGSPQANEIIQEAEQTFKGPPSPEPDQIYPFGPSPREKKKRPPPKPKRTPPPSPPYIFPQYSSPHTPIPQRPIRRPKGYVSPPGSPMYGPEERPQGYASPPPPAQERSQFMPSPPAMIPGVQYDTGIDDELPPLFPMSPPPFPDSPEDLIRREARRLFSGKQPCNVCVTDPAPPPPCGPCDSEAKTPKRSRSKRKGKWPVSRSPSPVGLDEFEEMERLAQMDTSPAPCAGPPMPQFPGSPGEAQRIRQRAAAQYNLLGQEPLVTPEGVPGPSRRRTGQTPPQEEYNSDFDATPEKLPTPVQRFPKAKRRVFRTTPPPQPQPQMMDGFDMSPGYGSPLAEETPPLDFASPLPNILQPEQMYFPGECMPCGSPDQFPSRAELREHQFVPDRSHARISQRTPFGQAPGRVQHRESVSAFRQMPAISEGEQGHRMDYTPKRPRHDVMHSRDFRSPRVKPDVSPVQTESQLFGEVLKRNVEVSSEMYRTPKVCPSARKRVQPRSQLGESYTQRHQQFVGAAQEGRPTDFEEDQEFKDLADQAELAFDYEGGLLDVSPPQDFEAGQNYYPEIAAAADNLLKTFEDYEAHNLKGYYDAKFAAPKQIADIYGSPEYVPKARSPPPKSPVRAKSPCPRGTSEPSPAVTCPGAALAAAEAPKKKPAGKKALKETRSSLLRKEKLAKQQQAEKEAQMKKEKAAAAKKEKIQAKKKAAQAQRAAAEAQRAAAQQAAIESPLPGPQFMDELQQHQVQFPGYQRGLLVGQKMKRLDRVSRRQFAGFEEHPREEEEPEDEGYLEDYPCVADFADEQPPEDFDFTPPRTPNYEEMLFSQQFEDTPPMDDFLDPSLLEREDDAWLMTPPRRPPSPEHIAASPIRQPRPPCVPCSPPLDEFEQAEREMEEMQRQEEQYLPEEFLTQMEQQRQETIGALGMAAGKRMAPPSADRHMERLDRHIARDERRAKKKRSQQYYEDIQRRTAEQEASIEAERVQAEYDRPPSPLMAYSPVTPPRPDGGECVPCYPVEDGYFFEAIQTPHAGLFEGDEDMQAAIAGYQSPEQLSPYRIPEGFGPEIYDYQREQEADMNRQVREDMQFQMDYSDVDALDQEQFDGYYSPPPLSPELSPECVPCSPPNRQQLEAEERQRAMIESYYQQEKQEIRQMFGPSGSPISPGPDESFRTAVGSHQVPERFRRGGRPKFRVRDEVGSRDFTMVLPRKYEPTGMETIQEPEPRRAPQPSGLARPDKIPSMAGRPGPTAAPASCGSGGPCGGSQAARGFRPPTSYAAAGQGQRSLRPSMPRQQGQSQMQRPTTSQARGKTCPGPSSSRSRLQGSSSQSRLGSQGSSRTSLQTQQERDPRRLAKGGTCPGPSSSRPGLQGSSSQSRIGSQGSSRTSLQTQQERDPRRLVRKTSSYKKIVYRRN